MFQANPIAIPFAVSGAISGLLAIFAWRRRGLPMAPAFAVMMAGEAVWALVEALELVTVPMPVKRVFFELRVAGAVTAILAMVAFVLRYTGHSRWLVPRRFGAILRCRSCSFWWHGPTSGTPCTGMTTSRRWSAVIMSHGQCTGQVSGCISAIAIP